MLMCTKLYAELSQVEIFLNSQAMEQALVSSQKCQSICFCIALLRTITVTSLLINFLKYKNDIIIANRSCSKTTLTKENNFSKLLKENFGTVWLAYKWSKPLSPNKLMCLYFLALYFKKYMHVCGWTFVACTFICCMWKVHKYVYFIKKLYWYWNFIEIKSWIHLH